MNLAEFRDLLESHGCQPKGDREITAKCPAHDDHNPSLSVTSAPDGRLLVYCHAQCPLEAITEALGCAPKDLFAAPEARNGKPRIVAVYPYHDENSKTLFEVVRFDPKDFRQRRPDGTWKVSGIRQVPFHLPELIAAVKAARTVYVPEGEKDVLAIEREGFAATCNAGGAGKWRADFAPFFKGAAVVIIADKDTPGRKHAADVASKLQGTAAGVKILELPDVDGRPVKDAADYFAAGGQAADLDAMTEAAPEAGETAPDPTPIARPLSALVHHADNDPRELLRHRFLCQGGGLLLVGPTGIGKSSLLLQSMILWGLGKPAFGIEPSRPLKSVLIQAENDDGDLAEMRDGVINGLELTPTEAARAQEQVLTYREDVKTGALFFSDTVAPLLEAHKPDLLGIDPALAYIGGESNSQMDVGAFLRNGLNPLLHRFGCGAIIAHHTNKPPTGSQKPNWQAGDFAYLGAGSAEWCNWARAVLALRSIGSHDVFELQAGKRGARLKWEDANGDRAYARHLAHSPRGICWLEAEPDQVPKPGRPRKCEEDAEEMLSILPADGLTPGEWMKRCDDEAGITGGSFHRARRGLKAAGRILKSKGSGKWMPTAS